MMEPMRPFVDSVVYDIYDQNGSLEVEITKETKKPLLELLTKEVVIRDLKYPLLESLHLMASSLVDCYTGERIKIDFPVQLKEVL